MKRIILAAIITATGCTAAMAIQQKQILVKEERQLVDDTLSGLPPKTDTLDVVQASDSLPTPPKVRRRRTPRPRTLRPGVEVGLNPGDGEMYSKYTLIINYDPEIGKKPLLKAVKKYKATLIYDYRIVKAIAIRIPDGKDIHEAIEYFQKVKGVTQVNRDRIMHLHTTEQAEIQ